APAPPPLAGGHGSPAPAPVAVLHAARARRAPVQASARLHQPGVLLPPASERGPAHPRPRRHTWAAIAVAARVTTPGARPGRPRQARGSRVHHVAQGKKGRPVSRRPPSAARVHGQPGERPSRAWCRAGPRNHPASRPVTLPTLLKHYATSDKPGKCRFRQTEILSAHFTGLPPVKAKAFPQPVTNAYKPVPHWAGQRVGRQAILAAHDRCPPYSRTRFRLYQLPRPAAGDYRHAC